MPDTPYLLAFDTSAAHCAVALFHGNDLQALHFAELQRGQAEALFPALESVLQTAGSGFANLSAVGVGIGPGNFTGLRVAVSAARGLALGLGIPAIGVSAFDVAKAVSDDDRDTILLPAPRGAAYRMRYEGSQPLGAADILEDAPSDALTRIDWQESGIAALGRIALERYCAGTPLPRPAPLYVKPADAAPARDPAPLLLP